MGAGASIAGFEELSEEVKVVYQAKYEAMIADGKSTEEALNELQQPQLSVKTINLIDLENEIEAAINNRKTPLIVDCSDDDKVNTYFNYRSVVAIDGKKMGLDKSMRNISMVEIMEDARKKLVYALQMGFPFVIMMTKSVTDFASCFNDTIARTTNRFPQEEMFLPIELFDFGGKQLLDEPFREGLIRAEERQETAGLPISRNPDGFYVVLTTQFSPKDYEEYLFGNAWGLPKPKDKYQVLIISP